MSGAAASLSESAAVEGAALECGEVVAARHFKMISSDKKKFPDAI